ncbi:MAG: hypothetical protein JKY67_08510 [Pseudomonadales bacterium]|nr:hypothetical protein [Pseudomonadales bacterium]
MAALTRASGYQNYTSDGSNFIPEIWSGKLVEKFYESTVFGAIANTDYEGEIKDKGDTVKISTVPNVTISAYEIGGTITYEELTSTGVDLEINYADMFAFRCDDIDKKQSHIADLDSWANETSQKMKIQTDTAILGSIYSDVAAVNAGLTAGKISGDINLGTTGTPLALTKTNILDFIVDMGTVHDEQNVPEEGRWLVLPAWVCALIKKSDLQDASIAGDATSILRNGRVGMIDRFTIYNSNNVSKVTTYYHVLSGHKSGLTFAAQMTNMETLRIPDSFGNYVRGLQVYGFQVINDTVLNHAVVTK